MACTWKLLASVSVVSLLSFVPLAPAHAKCTKMGFSVNDYGKDGPTKDAKELLDKHIAKEMAAKGVKKYTTGTKTVTCELFLNFIVFDEHTCKAEATVCWGDGPAGAAPVTASGGPAAETAAAPVQKAAAPKAPAIPKTTATIPTAAVPAPPAPSAPRAPAAPRAPTAAVPTPPAPAAPPAPAQ